MPFETAERGRLIATTAALALVFGTVAAAPGRAEAGPRIVNGLPTQAQPTTGALVVPFGDEFLTACSGTLIGCQTFLTAAHCVCVGDKFSNCGAPDPADYRVYLQHGGILEISSIAVHPGYDLFVKNDTAVLTLASPLDGVPPTPINTSMTPAFGTTAAIAGFGITGGGNNDTGLSREGMVETASCVGFVPQPAHLCWEFVTPVGPAGVDSNTCSGDSGGPLFVDFGGGPVVAGITSGGSSSSCRANSFSFDTNVFENATFIQSAASPDPLGQSACGTISQVGEPATAVFEMSSIPPEGQQQKCRKDLRRRYSRYVRSHHKLLRKCLNRVAKGSQSGPCPDATTAGKIQKAADKVDPVKIAKKCPASSLPTVGLGMGCTGAMDASDLAACIIADVDLAVAAMIDVEYADSVGTGPLPDRDQYDCQRTIARVMDKYARARLKAMTKCQADDDRGRNSGCPDDEATERIADALADVEPKIEQSCTNGIIAALDAAATFGGSCAGETTTTGIATCEVADHDLATDDLLGIVIDITGAGIESFEVPASTSLMRLALNGIDDFGNDIDLYLALGTTVSTTVFDFSSPQPPDPGHDGAFKVIEVVAPTAGTWTVLVDQASGDEVPYQLTVTMFQ